PGQSGENNTGAQGSAGSADKDHAAIDVRLVEKKQPADSKRDNRRQDIAQKKHDSGLTPAAHSSAQSRKTDPQPH
ncbi:unnamed protein product, partial [marine sediment metagenome]